MKRTGQCRENQGKRRRRRRAQEVALARLDRMTEGRRRRSTELRDPDLPRLRPRAPGRQTVFLQRKPKSVKFR